MVFQPIARHPFWELVAVNSSSRDRALLSAILNLSAGLPYNHTFEEIYDSLLSNRVFAHNAVLDKIAAQLRIMEGISLNTNTVVLRLQSIQDAMKKQLDTIQTALATAVQAQADANTRLENDIAALRNSAGSGDVDTLNAIADSLDSTLTGFKAVTDQLNAAATAEAAVDVAPPPVPPVTVPTLTISPVTASVSRTGTMQFSATGGVAGGTITFKATSGSLDANNLYTPPTDPTITSDIVVATSQDGQSATASLSIVG